jgi:hypothetical protein
VAGPGRDALSPHIPLLCSMSVVLCPASCLTLPEAFGRGPPVDKISSQNFQRAGIWRRHAWLVNLHPCSFSKDFVIICQRWESSTLICKMKRRHPASTSVFWLWLPVLTCADLLVGCVALDGANSGPWAAVYTSVNPVPLSEQGTTVGSSCPSPCRLVLGWVWGWEAQAKETFALMKPSEMKFCVFITGPACHLSAVTPEWAILMS